MRLPSDHDPPTLSGDPHALPDLLVPGPNVDFPQEIAGQTGNQGGCDMHTGKRILLPIVAAIVTAMMAQPDRAFAQGIITGNDFNPAISLVLNGKYSSYSNDPENYEISGFLLDDESGLTSEGFALDETELTVSANVDDWFYGFADIVFEDTEDGTEVELEEAYFQSIALPSGFTAKGGKFLSAIGYHNSFHPHSWDFADVPLAYRAMLGSAFTDVGVQGAWVAPTDLYLQLGGEIFRGDSFPAAGSANDGAGAWSLFAKLGGDIGVSNSWIAGLSWLSYDVDDFGAELGADGRLLQNGDGDLYIAEFVWKWAPNGNARQRNLKIQAEYFHRKEDGDSDVEMGGLVESGDYDIEQDAFYVQGIYQFRPGWRVGARYDWLSADNDLSGISLATPLDGDDRDPDRISLMLDFAHSEFSRIRLQYARDDSTRNSDDQIILQYVMSLGAHGGHKF